MPKEEHIDWKMMRVYPETKDKIDAMMDETGLSQAVLMRDIIDRITVKKQDININLNDTESENDE